MEPEQKHNHRMRAADSAAIFIVLVAIAGVLVVHYLSTHPKQIPGVTAPIVETQHDPSENTYGLKLRTPEHSLGISGAITIFTDNGLVRFSPEKKFWGAERALRDQHPKWGAQMAPPLVLGGRYLARFEKWADKGRVHLYDMGNTPPWQAEVADVPFANAVFAASAKGDLLAAAGRDQIQVYEVRGGKPFPSQVLEIPKESEADNRLLAIHPADSTLMLAVSAKLLTFAIDAKTGQFATKPAITPLPERDLYTLQVSADGKWLLMLTKAPGDKLVREVHVFRWKGRGAMQEAEGSPYEVDYYTWNVLVDRASSFIYSVGAGQKRDSFRFDTNRGTLTRIDGPTGVAGQIEAGDFATIGDREFLISGRSVATGIKIFEVDRATGKLTFVADDPEGREKLYGTVDAAK